MNEPLETVAYRCAVNCRRIVQTCLREDEWGDADQEFFAVIVNELRRVWPWPEDSTRKPGDRS